MTASADAYPERPTPGATPASACLLPPDPMGFRLVPTPRANAATGTVDMVFAPSPFGVSTTRDGHHDFELEVVVEGLTVPDGTSAVVWATSPNLGDVRKLGVLGADGRLEARISLNKFLVFLTAEEDPEIDRWSGPVLLRGSSPTGRMHSMAGHGPFQGEPCNVIGF